MELLATNTGSMFNSDGVISTLTILNVILVPSSLIMYVSKPIMCLAIWRANAAPGF